MVLPSSDQNGPAHGAGVGRLLAPDMNLDFPAPWFMRSDYYEDERYKMLPWSLKEKVDIFMRDGYIVFEGAISEEMRLKVLDEVRQFTSRNKEYFNKFRNDFGYLERVINLHLALPCLVDMFSSAVSVLEFQDALFNSKSSIYTSLYFEKGSSQDIHRDTPYFTTRPEYCYFGTWFGLEDADVGNGCLQVIPGGHLVPELDRKRFVGEFLQDGEVGSINTVLFDAYQKRMVDQCLGQGLKIVPVPLKKGDVLIWHPQLPHGGNFIAEPHRTRNSIVMHTVPENCPVYQAYAFFNPELQLPNQASWPFRERAGRQYAAHEVIEVMHQDPRPVNWFA